MSERLYTEGELTQWHETTGTTPRPDYVDDLLSAKRLRDDGVFAPEAVQRLVRKARAGQVVAVRDNMALSGILSTQLLVHRFVRDFN